MPESSVRQAFDQAIFQTSVAALAGAVSIGLFFVNARGGQANKDTRTASPNSEYIVVKTHGSHSINNAS